MNVILSKGAWLGLRRHIRDTFARLTVENLIALACPDAQYVTATLAGDTLSEITDAYNRWSTSVRLMRS